MGSAITALALQTLVLVSLQGGAVQVVTPRATAEQPPADARSGPGQGEERGREEQE